MILRVPNIQIQSVTHDMTDKKAFSVLTSSFIFRLPQGLIKGSTAVSHRIRREDLHPIWSKYKLNVSIAAASRFFLVSSNVSCCKMIKSLRKCFLQQFLLTFCWDLQLFAFYFLLFPH